MEQTTFEGKSGTAVANGFVVVNHTVTQHYIGTIAYIDRTCTISRFYLEIAASDVNTLQYHGFGALYPNDMLQVALISNAVRILIAGEDSRCSRGIGERRRIGTFEIGRITTDERYRGLDSEDVGIRQRGIDTACKVEDIARFRHTAGKHFLEIGGAKRALPRLTVALGGGEVGADKPRSGGHLSCEKQDERQDG